MGKPRWSHLAATLAPSPKYDLDIEQVSQDEAYIFADILHWHYSEAPAIIFKAVGVSPDETVLVWASPPCKTLNFTDHAYNQSDGRITPEAPHGCNYRDRTCPERPPCCHGDHPECKYAAKARLHDTFLPWLQNIEGLRFGPSRTCSVTVSRSILSSGGIVA